MIEKPAFENERDIEIPYLWNWLNEHDARYGKILDVGCAFNQYIQDIKPICGELHGLDIIRDEKVIKYYDKFINEDIATAELEMYDWTFSISTVEHIGVEYLPTPLYREFQIEAINKIIRQAKYGSLITMPYGEPILFDGFYNNLERKMIDEIAANDRHVIIQDRYFSNPDPKNPLTWGEIKQEVADHATNNLNGCVQCVCILEAYK